MTADELLIGAALAGIGLSFLYFVVEILVWRSHREREIEANLGLKELYKRSFQRTRQFVQARRLKSSASR